MKFTPQFQRMTAALGSHAELIVISHPWVYLQVRRRAAQKLIYDAHNCEAVVKRQILGDTATGRDLVKDVEELEGRLCREADLIFACSEDDAREFVRRYHIARNKIVLVPNGVDIRDIQPATPERKHFEARAAFRLPIDKPVLIFIGSGYAPNTEAAAFLVKTVAPALPQCTIVIAGSVRDAYAASGGPAAPENVSGPGIIDSAQRRSLYQAADIALNPMFPDRAPT